ncbi:MAG: branched-chain amino acid transport system II carrier protein [Chlamydiales bacterium]|nr:branched-chain amino acid transport system II carrier protein [Chlamydiales bacterium]
MLGKFKSISISSGLAMFAMFFGAGNVVFPLIVGRAVEGGLLAAMLGLFLTAVLIPFAGLVSMTLYEGDYIAFFKRVGNKSGFLMLLLIIGLIGPFGGIPRCITLTFATLHLYIPGLNLVWFALASIVLIFLCCFKENSVIDLLGLVLTPLLLLFLGIILVKGLFFSPHSLDLEPFQKSQFVYGLTEGYNTMDLLAAFFFSSIVCESLKSKLKAAGRSAKILSTAFYASCIGASFLAIIYMGFAWLAASHSHLLVNVAGDQLLAKIGGLILGPLAGFVISMAVGMACLTTAIGLSTVSAEFIERHVFKEKLGYIPCLIIVLLITGLVSMLKFSGIVAMLSPILTICYPAFLTLCIVNLLHKTMGYKPVKTPVFTVLVVMLISSFF